MLKEIEEYLSKPIKKLEIDKKDYSATIEFTMDVTDDWKALLKEEEENEKAMKLKKQRKKK